MKRRLSSKRTVMLSWICVFVMGLVLSMSVVTYAKGTTSTEQAQKNLTTYVQSKMMSNTYELEGGGYVAGSSLFTGDASKGYDLDEAMFNTLSSSAQSEAVDDIAMYSNEAASPNKAGTGTNATGVTSSTIQDWWKQLQQKNGVGSKFLNTILQNTKPDFVAANAIWKPFAGPIGILLGVLAVATMSLLGITIIADIMYIVLPPVRAFVGEDENGDRPLISHVFSFDAIYAVKKAESDSDSGTPKQALGIFLKRRILALVLLCICLMYLVQGQIYTLCGYILDLMYGLLGF